MHHERFLEGVRLRGKRVKKYLNQKKMINGETKQASIKRMELILDMLRSKTDDIWDTHIWH